MNAVLSMSYNLESYPNLLYKAGYRVVSIEPQFKINGSATPDLVFMSEEYAIIAECKSGEYYAGTNLKRYDEIKIRHLVEKGIDIPSRNIQIDIGVFAGDNIELLSHRLSEIEITYPQVKIDKVIQKVAGNDFKDPELMTLFLNAVEIKGKPLQILKFSVNSSREDIAPHVFQAIVARSINDDPSIFTVRDLAQEIFEDTWDSLDSKFQKALCEKIKEILRFAKKDQLNPYLRNNGEKWSIKIRDHWKSRKKFAQDCQKVIQNFPQRTLHDWIKKSS